jgi:uncharacterized membrane protein YdjX (TVP38/TMEM64 family)
MGFWGELIFIPLYALAVTVLIPGSALTVLSGAMFGSLTGVILVSLGSTLGACLSFILSRYVIRRSFEQWFNKQDKFHTLNALTVKHGALIVVITRLVHIFPYALLNYGFGLTNISFRTFIFWSWLGMLPGTIMSVVGGDAVSKMIARGNIPWVLVSVFAGVSIIATFLAYYARRILKEK